MKLKTLNDLEWDRHFTDEIKQLAIKWVKKGDKKLKEKIVIDWHGAFMDFHNITEEDLK